MLSKLSPELRNEIYKLVLSLREPVEFLYPVSGDDTSLTRLSKCNTGADALVLLRTCKQINIEARSLAYFINEFRLHTCMGNPSKALDSFAKQIGGDTMQIAHIKLDIYSFTDYCSVQMIHELAKSITRIRHLTLRFAARLHPEKARVPFELEFESLEKVRPAAEACATSFAAMIRDMKATTGRTLYPWTLQSINIEEAELEGWLDRLASQIEHLGGDCSRWSRQ